MSGNPVIWVS